MIHEKLKSKTYLIVEPNLELFKLSLFVTNYAKLAQEANLILSIAEDELNFRNSFDQFYNESFVFNHYFKFFQLSNNFSFYIKTIQNKLVSQDFYTYPYNRTFLSLYRTHSYIMEEYKLLDISRIHNLDFTKKPILYLAAGPSLQKNIEFVKKNQNKFTIVTIYATLPLLEKHNIKPDIVTQYDEQNHAVLNTLEKIEDINFFKNTIFIFSSHVNTKLMNSFRKENIYIFQAMFDLKKGFGTLTSPSIGELTYALLLILGAKKVYLIGLDLAFDTQTGETHIEGHSGANAFANLKDEEDSSEENYSYRKNTIRVKGNFVDTVKTTPSFKTNIDSFSYFTEQFKQADVEIYNLSNGAYLLDTIPLKIENIQINSLEDKKIDSTVIINDLNKISTVNYSTEDMENKNLKISNAKKMKKALESFFKIKNYTKFGDYQNNLIITLQTLLFNENKDSDLKSVLTNYSQHVIPFIFHLFNVNTEKKNLSFIYELNKVLKIQFNKIVDTYLISVLYSKDESSQLTKKLNKQIKEYKIDKTLYCEPIFKELSETAPLKDSKISSENAIGMFAINENLENKNLIEYITNIVNTYDCRLKIFYLFEYQKNKAQQIFKNIKNKIEFIIPRNLESIASEIEVYIDLNKTSSLKDINNTLLHKHSKIYCISFLEKFYLKNKQLKELLNKDMSLREKIQNNNVPNKKYTVFMNNLYYYHYLNEIDNNLYLKDSIGLFVTKDNLLNKDFVSFIKDLIIKFSNIQFKIFYLNEEIKPLILDTFSNQRERINFIIPDNLNDVIKEIEIFIKFSLDSQDINNIYSTILSRCKNIFPLTFNSEDNNKSWIDYNNNRSWFGFKNPLFEFTEEEIINFKFNPKIAYTNKLFQFVKKDVSIKEDVDFYDFYYFENIKLILDYSNLKEKLFQINNYYINNHSNIN